MPGNADLVQRALGAMRSGDMEAARSLVADEFTWHVPGESKVSGEVSGARGWSEKLRLLLSHGLQPEVIALLEGPHRVAVFQRNRAEVGENRLDVHVVNLFTLGDGRVLRLDTFFDDQRAAEKFWDAVLP